MEYYIMARKLKHSKIKNTSILFELLTRQITADVLAGKSTKSVKIVKKFFNERKSSSSKKKNPRIPKRSDWSSDNKLVKFRLRHTPSMRPHFKMSGWRIIQI